MPFALPVNARSKPTTLVLAEHQREAVCSVLDAWRDEDRATVVMACGTGKTLVGHAVATETVAPGAPARIGIFVPSLGLIKQTMQTWRTFQSWGERFRVIAVCSDPGVEADDIASDEIPAVVTTDATELAQFLGDGAPDTIDVIVSTYHSSWVVADALMDIGAWLDIGIADEAHNTAGATDKSFGLMLRDEAVPIRKRLFMTATPRITRHRTDESVSMDNAAIYGPLVYNLSFREAVERGIICDWEVLISVITRDEVAAYGFDRAVDGLADHRLQEAAGRAAIAKALQSTGARKAISFHSTILAARDFARDELANHRLLPGFNVYHVNGLDRAGRHKSMASFVADENALVTNARCLTEGVDIPAVDLVAFLGRKSSRIDIVQAIGRALRTAPGKTKGYILLPVLLDPRAGQAVDDAIAESDLAAVWNVLAALRDNDELFASNIVRTGRHHEDNGDGRFLPPEWVKIVGDVDIETIRKGIEVVALDELLCPFDYGVRQIAAFIAREGHAQVPTAHIEPGGFWLGFWVGKKRREYRAKLLTAEKVAALEGLPGWVWSVHDESWKQGMTALSAFVAREGHALVPSKHVEPDGFKLGVWVSSRRKDYREGALLAERVTALEGLPGWMWVPSDDFWKQGMTALRAFVAREGHASVPGRHIEPDGFKLGSWVGTRRKDYRTGRLPPERVAELESLAGWVWNTRDRAWAEGLKALHAFVAREGHAQVPTAHIEPDGFKLGTWVCARRQEYRTGRLCPARGRELARLGVLWVPYEESWERGMTALHAFVAREGHALVASKHSEPDGFKLGSWVVSRRQEYRTGRLLPERVAELETVPGWAWTARPGRAAKKQRNRGEDSND